MVFESILDIVKVSDGAEGKATYLHIKYSDVENPTQDQMYDFPSDYIGFYNGSSPTPPTDPSEYTWVKITGKDGRDGLSIRGPAGADGQDAYLHIKYSNDGGQTFTANYGDEPGDYIGTYTDQNPDPVLIESFYTWALIKGAQGIPGLNGYFHVAYSANPDGNPMTTMPVEDTKYMGVYSDFEQTGSTDYTKYKWNQIRGDDGIGIDGTTYFMWVKYADDPTGPMTDDPDGKDWIGIAYNQESPIESDNNEDYTWSKFRGPQGVKGDQGDNTYMWIKYADSSTPAPEGIYDDPEGHDYMGFAYNKFTQEESSDYRDYQWVYIRGEQGIPGIDCFLHIKYSNDGGVTFTENNGETIGTWIGTCTDRNQNDPTEVTAYKWAKFMGDDGHSYTIALSNESHGFSSDGDGAVQAESIEIQVCAWSGTEPVATTVSIPSDIPDGMTIVMKEGTNGTLAPIVQLSVDSSFSSSQGVIEFPIMCEGLNFVKAFSYCVVRGGKDGVDGRVYGIDVSTPFILAPFIHKAGVNGGFEPGTVTFTPYYRDGLEGNKVGFDSDIELLYSLDGAAWSKIGSRVTNARTRTLNTNDLPQNSKHVKCVIYTNGGQDPFCEQSVVVKDNTDENASLFSNETGTVLIQGSRLVAGSITASKIKSGTITATEIASNTITATQIASGAIGTDELAANSVTAGKISVSTLSAIAANVGTLTAGLIHSNSYSYSSGNYSNSGIEISLNGNGYIRAKNFYIDSSGNAYFKGNLSGATGTFSGTLSSAGGTFTGTLSGVNGTFSGSLSGASGSFSGTVNASTIDAKQKYRIYSSALSDSIDIIKIEKVGSSPQYDRLSVGILTGHYTYAYSWPIIQFQTGAVGSTISLNGADVFVANNFNAAFISESGTRLGVKYALSSHTHSEYAAKSHLHSEIYSPNYTYYANIGNGNGNFTPGQNGQQNLGASSGNQWNQVYCTGTFHGGSDRNMKCFIQDIDERYEKTFMDLKPRNYMRKKVYDYEDEHDRIHCGLIAQEVEEAAIKNGLSCESFAVIGKDILDVPTPDGRYETYNLAYMELHGLEIHMIQKAIHRIEELESQVESLQEQLSNISS